MTSTARKAAKSAAAVLVGAGVGAAGVAVVSSNLAHAGDTAPAGQSVQQQGSLPQGVVPQPGAQDQTQPQVLPQDLAQQDQTQQQGRQGMVLPGQGGPQGSTHGS